MALSLSRHAPELSSDERFDLSRRIFDAIARSPFRRLDRWRHAVAVWDGAELRVQARADLAAWLRANDLPDVARELVGRTPKRGELVVYAVTDGADVRVFSIAVLRELADLFDLDTDAPHGATKEPR